MPRSRARERTRLPESERPVATPSSLELAHEVLEAISRRDVSRLIELARPDVEWRSFFAIGEGGAYRGHDGTRRYMRDLEDAFNLGVAEVDDGVAVGDVAFLVGRLRFRGKGSGVESEAPAGWVLRFRAGKLVRFQAIRDPEQVLTELSDG